MPHKYNKDELLSSAIKAINFYGLKRQKDVCAKLRLSGSAFVRYFPKGSEDNLEIKKLLTANK